jgi:hypothetical protein
MLINMYYNKEWILSFLRRCFVCPLSQTRLLPNLTVYMSKMLVSYNTQSLTNTWAHSDIITHHNSSHLILIGVYYESVLSIQYCISVEEQDLSFLL